MLRLRGSIVTSLATVIAVGTTATVELPGKACKSSSVANLEAYLKSGDSCLPHQFQFAQEGERQFVSGGDRTRPPSKKGGD